MPFSFEYVIEILPSLLQGTLVTVKITILGMFFANLWGIVVSVIRWVGVKGVTKVFDVYITIVRNLPFVAFAFYGYYTLPGIGITLEPFGLGILILALYYGAFIAEVYRGSIQSVEKGQLEAAEILNLSRWKTMRVVILPQIFIVSLPNIVNSLISTFKDSAYLGWITVRELMWHAKNEGSLSFRMFEPFFLATLIYFVISYPVALLGRAIEKKIA
jgi:His/Glu/Gln/Arg/opine family amino acid ABC transporter permease subunit